MNNLIMYRETFASYGLNKNRNFLEKGYVELDNEDELAEWMQEQLVEHGCPESAIFAINYNLDMYVAITEYDEDEEQGVISVLRFGWDMDMFAKIDSEYRLCCYGIIEEIKPGIWKILED